MISMEIAFAFLRWEDFQKELCGGTGPPNFFGEAGALKITSESSVASGVRRIVAVTGAKAYEYISEQERVLESLSEILKSTERKCQERSEKLLKERSELQKSSINKLLDQRLMAKVSFAKLRA